jgi:hypothetical protein
MFPLRSSFFGTEQFGGILPYIAFPRNLRFPAGLLHPGLFTKIHFGVLLSNIRTKGPAHCNVSNTHVRYEVGAFVLSVQSVSLFGLYTLESSSLSFPPFRIG